MGVQQEDELEGRKVLEEEAAEVAEGMETQDPYDWENDEKWWLWWNKP